MSILPVLKYPHPLLKTKCKPVSKINAKTSKLIDNMIETMYSFPGCIGISASLVGKPLRIIIFDVSKNKKAPPSNHNLTIMVNPVIIEKKGKTITREGCLSLPDFTGNATSAERIKVKGKDKHSKRIEFYLVGFESVAFQHEIDHLYGILFIDRISSLKTDIFMRKRYL